MMKRLPSLSLLAVISVLSMAACGGGGEGAIDTLPPIRTTTTSSTTTTTPDSRRHFYEVKPGDNLSEIARSYQVPRSEIVTLNGLSNNGELLQVGQIIEIPTDVVLDDTLPPPTESTDP